MPYAELHCLTNFSFQRGASHAEELVERAHQLGYRALAVTDECTMAGVVRAHVATRDHPLHLIIGAEFHLEALCLILLAPDRTAYGEICRLITRARRRAEKGSYEITPGDFDEGLSHCLLIITTPETRLVRAESRERILRLRDAFRGRCWLGLELTLHDQERWRARQFRELAEALSIPLTACGNVCMHVRARQPLMDVMTAIRHGEPVQTLGRQLAANSERHLRSLTELHNLFPADLLAESVRIAERCTFSLDELSYEYPRELVPAGRTPAAHLRKLVEEGVLQRWPAGAPVHVRPLIERELALIAELSYEHYFLTVYDIVCFARSQKILCQGRGSAANSVVCFCLGITEVDPGRIEVLFERFISKERNEPPDIDVDFEHERREEVIQYIYRKYGRHRAALTATVISYRPKSAIRDVGRALGFELNLIDQLSKSLAWWDKAEQLQERLRAAGVDPQSGIVRRFVELVHDILGFPRHLSQHVGGFLISEGPIDAMVPIENAAMADRTIIQWDKDDIDALGLLKVDVLGLGMLSCIRRALDFVNTVRGTQLTMARVPAEDPAVYDMIQRADTVGVFQIESRAQMSMLPRLKPACFYDLVIEVAIVRPGPIQGDMVHPYLRRRNGEEPVEYANEEIKGVLSRTLGVPLFQEQVIKLAMVAAGFTPGEADQLRRAMAAWKRKGGLGLFETKLIRGMIERGYDRDFAERVFAQIRGFGEYGFPESHAASFALLVYVSSWLKHYEPAAFCAAILNSQPMGFYSASQLVQDARRHQVEVRAVDVLYSEWDCTLEPPSRHGNQPAVRLGFRLVEGIGREAGERILQARNERRFRNAEDLTRRAQLDRHELECLADADALRTLSGHRHDALWDVQGVEAPRPLLAPQIGEPDPVYLPEPSAAQNLLADYRATGLTLGPHPLRLLSNREEIRCCAKAVHLPQLRSGAIVKVAGLVTGRQRPGTASGVVFVSLEDETGTMNVVVWARTFDAQRKQLLAANLLRVTGNLEMRDGVIHVIAGRCEDLSHLLSNLEVHARNFH